MRVCVCVCVRVCELLNQRSEILNICRQKKVDFLVDKS